MKKQPVYRVLDSFAGAGGFSLGFEQAGCVKAEKIELAVLNDFEDKFNINIQGKIIVNDSQETFNIDETYPQSIRGNILNVYNLQEIIKIFNLLYTEKFSENKSSKKKTRWI
jgi:hypothetical protein